LYCSAELAVGQRAFGWREYTTAKDGWKLRAGFAGVASAAPAETVTPLLPEQDRAYWTFARIPS